MTEPVPQQPNTSTRDHLLLIFAGVFAHPHTYVEIAEHVDDNLVGTSDAATLALWKYLQAHYAAPLWIDAAVELTTAGVPEVVPLLQRLAAAADEITPEKVVANAKRLARHVVNSRRRETLKAEVDAQPLTSLDIETIAAETARRYPHTTTVSHPLTPAECEHAATQQTVVIPTGFTCLDEHMRGWAVGEIHDLCARTGDGKSSVAYGIVRNQFFANAAKHRGSDWWEQFGGEWKQHGECGRKQALLRPLHAGHDHPEETYHAPHVLWFSLEEPLAQVLGRFYCDLLTIDRKKWMTEAKFRGNTQRTYAAEMAHIHEVLGAGRLTIVDYSTCTPSGTSNGDAIDVALAEQTLADVMKRVRAWARECQRRDVAEGVARPRLCMVDYGQLIQIPETTDRFAVLDKVATSLRKLAAETACAMLTTLMLLRGHESEEPSKDQIKGSSQFAQDAARILTLWPFGKAERNALRNAADGRAQPVSTEPDPWGDPVGASGGGFTMSETHALAEGGFTDHFGIHCRRAMQEIRVTCEKDRLGDAGWRTPFAFDGRFARVTDALPDIDETGKPVMRDGKPRFTSYRENPEIMAVVKPPKIKRKD